MLRNFFLSIIIFVGLDFLWLGVIAKNFYEKELSSFKRVFSLPAAALAYILIAFGIAYFVIPSSNGEPIKALINGAFFGLVVYGAYDLTNLATLADFTLKMALVDIFWGVTICAATSFLVSYLA